MRLHWDQCTSLLLLDETNTRPPPCGSDEVVVAVRYSGICGTDLHILEHEFPVDATLDCLGHEVAGIVYEKGASVDHVAVGDPVVVDPNHECGDCNYCKKGKPHFCARLRPVGVSRPGGWQSHILIKGDKVFPVGSDLPLQAAVLAEPLSCVLHGFRRLGALETDARVLILGAGIIGILWALLFREDDSLPNGRVVIVDNDGERRRTAQRLGFQAQEEWKEPIDVLIDCTGVPAAIEHHIGLLDKGGKLLIFGCCPRDRKITLSPFDLYNKEITLLTSKLNPHVFPQTIDLLRRLYLSREEVFSNMGLMYFSLPEFRRALETLNQKGCTKAVFRLE